MIFFLPNQELSTSQKRSKTQNSAKSTLDKDRISGSKFNSNNPHHEIYEQASNFKDNSNGLNQDLMNEFNDC